MYQILWKSGTSSQTKNSYTRALFLVLRLIYDMPTIDEDGIVHDITSHVYHSLKPPHTIRPLKQPRKKRIESQFMDKKTVYCSRCHGVGHNRKTCKNPVS